MLPVPPSHCEYPTTLTPISSLDQAKRNCAEIIALAVHLKQPCSSVGRSSGTSRLGICGSHQALEPAASSCSSSAVKPNPQQAPLAIASAMETFQLSFPLPRSLEARIYVHLTIQAKSVMIFLTTAAADELGTPPPMGSFVYALPDVSCSVGSPSQYMYQRVPC